MLACLKARHRPPFSKAQAPLLLSNCTPRKGALRTSHLACWAPALLSACSPSSSSSSWSPCDGGAMPGAPACAGSGCGGDACSVSSSSLASKSCRTCGARATKLAQHSARLRL